MTKTIEQIMAEQAKRDAAAREKWMRGVERNHRQLKKYVDKLKPLEGFTGRWQSQQHYYAGNYEVQEYVLENEDKSVSLTLRSGGSGSTSFEVQGHGRRTFDRRGVNDSFYWIEHSYVRGKPDRLQDFAKIAAAQLKRIAEMREYYGTALRVPGLQGGFTVSPQLLEEIKKRGCEHSFVPSGFGTGYRISAKQTRHCRRAAPELEKFLGRAPLFVTTMDCD